MSDLFKYFSNVMTAKKVELQDTKPSFEGKTIILTGGNTGVGFEAIVKFVNLGAKRVILACRRQGEEARQQIEARTGRKNVIDIWHLDMLDYESIKAFAKRAENELDRLDIAVLNAGVVQAAYETSKYGWEKTIQINVLSTVLLALLLLPKLRASKTADFTPVLELIGSGSHLRVTELKESQTEGPLSIYNKRENFGLPAQYGISKLFLEYAKAGLVEVVGKPSNPDVFVVSVCPGPTRSQLGRNAPWYLAPALWMFSTFAQHPTEVGARVYISGTTLGQKGHGAFWRNDQINPPAPLVEGEKGKKRQIEVWKEVVEALQKDLPEVKKLIG